MFKKNKYLGVILASITVIIFLVGCSNKATNTTTNNVSKSNSEKIIIAGLDGSNKTITVNDIKTFKPVEKDVIAVDSAGKKTNYSVKGALFEDILKKYGKSQKGFSGVRFTASDGYSIEVTPEILKSRDIIFAYEINGKPLTDNWEPIRIIIPDERAMYWASKLSKVELLNSIKKVDISKVIFLDTAIKTIPQQDYNYYKSKDKAVKNKDLLDKFSTNVNDDNVIINAFDGLVRNEQKTTFASAFTKFNGEDAPIFISPDLHVGMYVKGMVFFSNGGNLFFSLNKGLEKYGENNSDNKKIMTLDDIIKQSKLVQAQKYQITSLDGTKTVISSSDITKVSFYLNSKGIAVADYSNKKLKDVLSIEAVK
ncbi:MAG: molybdopterin-dependent oxidoreductase [Clostridiaceae bacterium]